MWRMARLASIRLAALTARSLPPAAAAGCTLSRHSLSCRCSDASIAALELPSEHAGMWQSRVEPAGRSVAWLVLAPSGMVPRTSARLCKTSRVVLHAGARGPYGAVMPCTTGLQLLQAEAERLKVAEVFWQLLG